MKYYDYLVEKIEKNISYSEYVAENLTSYSEYVDKSSGCLTRAAENLAKNIDYIVYVEEHIRNYKFIKSLERIKKRISKSEY